jgi:AraC-like DNA-binding protein
MKHNGFDRPAADITIDERRAELAARIARFAASDGVHTTPVPALELIRANQPTQRMPGVYEPCLCVVVQGRKRALLAEETYTYDALNYLVVSVTLPAQGHVIEASPDKPYLCLRLGIDPKVISELLIQMRESAANELPPKAASDRGMFVARMSAPLLDAMLRLVRLLDAPSELPVLAPLALREIYYRVLIGDLGQRLREVCEADSQAQRIRHAIELLRQRYAKPLRIEQLARAAHMSASSLHHRFKAVTAMSPHQFQKQLRLHEARRLMLIEGIEAASAGHRVGYESPSQFSREYRRLFGAPPRQEILQLREATAPNV